MLRRPQTADRRPQTAVSHLAVAALLVAFVFALAFTASRAQAQLVIVGVHTIEVDEGEVVALTQSVSGDATSVLNIVGAGRVDLSAASPNFLGTVFIRGAEFRLHGAGRMNGPNNAFIVENGGTLTFDTTGTNDVDHLSNTGNVTLSAGTIRALGTTQGTWGEDFGVLSLTGGANTIHIQKNGNTGANHLQPTNLLHGGTATLNLTGNAPYGLHTTENVRIRVRAALPSTSFVINGILPWASVEGADWVSPVAQGNSYWLVPLASYHTDSPSTWAEAHNVRVTGNAISLGGILTINSLKLEGTNVGLNTPTTLALNSGGLLTTGAISYITGNGTIRTSANRPLYAHIYSSRLILENGARFAGNIDLVKTGPGTLELDGEATHQLGTVTINEGAIRLSKGIISTRGDIVVGDGSGRDLFELAAQSNNRIVRLRIGLPTMTLHGNPYGPASDEAILRFGSLGNIRQALATLTIRDRGTLDFGSGGTLLPNILYLDQLALNDTGAILTIRNWVDRAGYLLVRRTWGNANVPPILSQIHFEGYGPARWEPHDLNGFDDYWQITPFPEPATYGAILGVVGLGLWRWRKRKRATATSA